MADIPELVATIARALADHPEAVQVSDTARGRGRTVHLKVASEDMGRIVGREGRVANAIRSLLAAAPDGPWSLEITD